MTIYHLRSMSRNHNAFYDGWPSVEQIHEAVPTLNEDKVVHLHETGDCYTDHEHFIIDELMIEVGNG